MILYLQSNYNGTFALAEKNKHINKNSDNPLEWCDFFTLEDNIPSNTPMEELRKRVVKEYNCRKLILQI